MFPSESQVTPFQLQLGEPVHPSWVPHSACMSFRAITSPASKAFTWFAANNNVIRKKISRMWEFWKRDILCFGLIDFEPEIIRCWRENVQGEKHEKRRFRIAKRSRYSEGGGLFCKNENNLKIIVHQLEVAELIMYISYYSRKRISQGISHLRKRINKKDRGKCVGKLDQSVSDLKMTRNDMTMIDMMGINRNIDQ